MTQTEMDVIVARFSKHSIEIRKVEEDEEIYLMGGYVIVTKFYNGELLRQKYENGSYSLCQLLKIRDIINNIEKESTNKEIEGCKESLIPYKDQRESTISRRGDKIE